MTTELSIRIPTGHTVMAANQDATRKKVEQYAARLLAGLGVSGAAKVFWEKQPPGAKTVEAVINGTTARLRHTTANSLGIAPAVFGAALCEDVLRNRVLFATTKVAHHAASKAHGSFHRFEEKKQERIAQILFAQGFGLQRLEQYAPPTDSADNTPETWAEACIGHLEAAQLVMLAHPSQIDPDEDPNDFNRLVESAGYFVDAAFKIKGIPFPKIRGEKQDDFAPDEMAFQINDLLFPVRTIGDATAENAYFVHFLTVNGAFFLNRGSVNFLLDSLEAAQPNLLALARTRFTTDFITSILRNLAAEGVSIRPLVRILEILISGGQDVYRQQPDISEAPPLSETVHLIATNKSPSQLDLSDWTELVRINLKNAIINRALTHFEEPLMLSCFFLETPFLQKIARFEALDPAEQTALRETLYRQVAENYLTPAGKIRPVITAAAFRKKIADLLAFEFPDTPVFSLQECLPRIVAKYDKGIF